MAARAQGDKLDYTISWTSANTDTARHMYVGGGEAVFIGYPGATPSSATAGNSAVNSKATAMNAVDGKTSGKGKKETDGETPRSYVMPTNPHLYVLDGLALVYDTEMSGGKAKVKKNEIAKKADGSRYTCVVYQV